MDKKSVYNENFYDNFEDTTIMAGKLILPYVIGILSPRSIIDFGCGEGAWLQIVKEIDQTIDVCGLDGSYVKPEQLKIEKDEFIPSDLKERIELGKTFDLAISLEVGEHLEEEYADEFVGNIIRHSDRVLFSAAIPEQGGTHHVNERWQSYWVEKFKNQGFYVSTALRNRFWEDERITPWRRQNLLFFSRNKEDIGLFDNDEAIINVVHPGMYQRKCDQVPKKEELVYVKSSDFAQIRSDNFRGFLQDESKCVYIFGAGHYAREFFSYIGQMNRNRIAGIIVSSLSGNPKQLCGVPVISKDDPGLDKKISVIVALEEGDEITKELMGKGFSDVVQIQEIIPCYGGRKDYWQERSKEINRYIDCFCQNKKLPIFSLIHIETINRCNGECNFCPVNKNQPQREYKKMEEALFYRIIDQLEEYSYKGILGLCCNNEPLLDERLELFAKYARVHLPEAFIYIETNGTLLNLERFKELSIWLDKIGVDNYSTSDMPSNIEEIMEYSRQNGLAKKISYSVIDGNARRSSRGGNAPNSKVWYTTEIPCPFLFNQMYVRPDGKLSMCCSDALEQETLGDLNKETILEAWEGEVYQSYREKYLENGRSGLLLCKYCNQLEVRNLWIYGEDFMSKPHQIFERGI